MSDIVQRDESSGKDPIRSLEEEITYLEKQLSQMESDLNAFETQIRSQLRFQILQIRELTSLYKQQKKDKKAKRLEQKKRGKNYKEPTGVKKVLPEKKEISPLSPDEQQELKRLYKEAIVYVHPDKFVNEDQGITDKATALTVQLNALYKSGNLDELSDFHEHIVSGNAMSHVPFQSESIKDSKAMLAYLQKKKENLIVSLEQIKQSPTYIALTTYENPLTFIHEIRVQFEQRIVQLKRRTRTK